MLNVVLIGPPGSGKGTQAQKIAEHWSLLHVSTGELLREEVKKESPLGLSVASSLAQGLLVSDDIVLGLIRDRITALRARGFLLDGYPRNIDQARELMHLLDEVERPITHVIEFVVSDQELISRIQGRQAVSGRSDDTEEVVRERLGVYARYSVPVLQFYREPRSGNGSEGIKFCSIDGVGSVDEVFLRIKSALD